MSDKMEIWQVHYEGDIALWRVVTLRDNVIVAERTFHEEKIAMEYLNSLKEESNE